MSIHVPGSKKLMEEDSTLYNKFQTAIAEVIGTAILVFVGCTTCVGSMGEDPEQFKVAFTFGIAVMIAIQVRCIRLRTKACYFFYLIDIPFSKLKKNTHTHTYICTRVRMFLCDKR